MRAMRKKYVTLGAAVACSMALSCGLAFADVAPSEGADASADTAATTANIELSLSQTHPSELTDYETETCLACHSYDDLAEATSVELLDEGGKTKFNPHVGHVSYDCTDCHTVDAAPVLQCNSCHYIDAPEGWETPTLGKAMYMDPEKIYSDLGYDVDEGYAYSNDPERALPTYRFDVEY